MTTEGRGEWEGTVGPLEHGQFATVSISVPHFHFISSSWNFSDKGDLPDTVEAELQSLKPNQIPESII